MPAPPRQPDRLPFSSARNATTSLRGRWGERSSSAAALPLCLRPGRSGTAARGGSRARDAPGPRRGVGSPPWALQGRTEPAEQKGRIPAGSRWQRVLLTPGPDEFSEGWALPGAAPHQGTAVPGAHPGEHRLPRPGRAAGARGAGIRPPSAAAAAGSASHRARRDPVPGWLCSPCLCPTQQTSSPLRLSPPASEQLIFIPFPSGRTHGFPPGHTDALTHPFPLCYPTEPLTANETLIILCLEGRGNCKGKPDCQGRRWETQGNQRRIQLCDGEQWLPLRAELSQ